MDRAARTIAATQELVVPRSIPITSPASGFSDNHRCADTEVVSASEFRRKNDVEPWSMLLRRLNCKAMVVFGDFCEVVSLFGPKKKRSDRDFAVRLEEQIYFCFRGGEKRRKCRANP